MGQKAGNPRRVEHALVGATVASLLAAILLMPSELFVILGFMAVIPAAIGLIGSLRKLILVADIILLSLLVAYYAYPSGQHVLAGSLDIVRLVVILAFHEFASMHLDARELMTPAGVSKGTEENKDLARDISAAFVYRGTHLGVLFLAATLVSEAFLLGGMRLSVSFTGVYGVAGGLMLLVAFVFLLFKITRTRIAQESA